MSLTTLLRTCLLSLLISLTGCHSHPKASAPLFNNLGTYHRQIETSSPLAQRYFDQGLVLFYSFEYGESIRSFHAAIAADPNCAMCYWGLALALGSKTDMPLDGHELDDAKAAIQTAAQVVNPINTEEKALIGALSLRYIKISVEKLQAFSGLCTSFSIVSGSASQDYSNAMKNLTALFPQDPDVKVLYAASLFDLSNWRLWNLSRHEPGQYTLEIIQVLESALALNKDHPGANHLYVHVTEFSPTPEQALPNANRLSQLVPGSEHLAHMPCHTYYALGNYHDAIVVNQKAVQVYRDYAASCQAQGFEPEVQYLYLHNYNYLIAAASMEGNKKIALDAAKEVEILTEPLAKQTIFLQKWLTSTILTQTLFGEWQAVLAAPMPPVEYQYEMGIWHYARGVAYVELKQTSSAYNELKQLNDILDKGRSDNVVGGFGMGLLRMSSDILGGLLAGQAGQTDLMLSDFQDAIHIQHTLGANDPPAWYFPITQLLGDAYYSAGRYADAIQTYKDDLVSNPQNGWSLYGLEQSLRASGDTAGADSAHQDFVKAWQYADIPKPISLLNAPG